MRTSVQGHTKVRHNEDSQARDESYKRPKATATPSSNRLFEGNMDVLFAAVDEVSRDEAGPTSSDSAGTIQYLPPPTRYNSVDITVLAISGRLFKQDVCLAGRH